MGFPFTLTAFFLYRGINALRRPDPIENRPHCGALACVDAAAAIR
jgi:hypothetical protein